MNRLEEFNLLSAELEQIPDALTGLTVRAKRRLFRRRLLFRPLLGLVGLFLTFTFLVNLSPTVARAVSNIPVLRELAKAVNFSTSLTTAVENQYVQPMNLKQDENGITASVEYLIVDQKQVNVFFRLSSSQYGKLYADPRVRAADGSPLSCSYGQNYFNWSADGENLQSLTIDFHNDTVPSALQVSFSVRDDLNRPEPLASFTFLLEFDPQFTATGKKYSVGQRVVLNGQTITVTDIEIYPSNLRLNIREDDNNTAWLQNLYFYIEDEQGRRFYPPESGILASGSIDTPSMTSYRTESPYFYDAKSLKLVITGATWLDKDMERVHMDLISGTVERLPQGVEFLAAYQQSEGWFLTFEVPYRAGKPRQAFFDDYYDADGKKCTFDSWGGRSTGEGSEVLILELLTYPYDDVWLCPAYSYDWYIQEPISVPLI